MSGAGRRVEVERKIDLVRSFLDTGEGVRLRGIDWFAWATAGASSAVLLAAETGIAEVLITVDGAWILTDEIEAERLGDEELAGSYTVQVSPWAEPETREEFVRMAVRRGLVLSDMPRHGNEAPLPEGVVAFKRRMMIEEIDRYREVGRLASRAVGDVLLRAEPGWSEYELAGEGARALLSRGIQPALVLAAGSRRLSLYRHPVPTRARLESGAMLVVCGRMHGLYANLTRFVSFGGLTREESDRHRLVREIEGDLLARSRPGVSLGELYDRCAAAYSSNGFPSAIHEHHQGGTTGYRAREVVAMPGAMELLHSGTPVAWNPSIRGAKIEDTFLVTDSGLVNLTADADWPAVEVNGIRRPLVLER